MNYDDMCEMLRILTIPLGPMAADAITALQARVADLTADILEDGKLRKIAYDQRDKAEADLAAAQRAYEITRQDCWNLTEKVIPNIRQDLAAARADAERYRWLRKVATPPTLAGIAWGNSEAACKFSDPDAAIDAAIAGEKK